MDEHTAGVPEEEEEEKCWVFGFSLSARFGGFGSGGGNCPDCMTLHVFLLLLPSFFFFLSG